MSFSGLGGLGPLHTSECSLDSASDGNRILYTLVIVAPHGCHNLQYRLWKEGASIRISTSADSILMMGWF